jgi:hypothetical protein
MESLVKLRRLWPAGLVVVLILGAMLRLAWVDDMEYKYDECWTFLQTQDDSVRETSLWLGIHNSTGFRCPGLSLWIFLAPAKILGITEPTELARMVQVCNVVALLLLAAFSFWGVPKEEREPWLWATALVAVNPLAVLFHRKIWPPSMLPLFAILTLIGWWYRERRSGAFLWGVVAALLGQIHPSGFFFAAAFVAWALLFDRPRVAWKSWFAGSCLGAAPMIPWFWYLLTNHEDGFVSRRSWHHLLEGKFWTRWALEPFGFGLDYSLYIDFPRFLAYPRLGGRPTYLVGVLHVVIGIALFYVVGRMCYRLWVERGRPWSEYLARFIGRSSSTAFTQNAAFWGFGLLLTLTALPLHRHYMIILFPLEFLWLARQALITSDTLGAPPNRVGRGVLAGLCIAQLLITACFLGYIHHTGGTRKGDYGIAYRINTKFRHLTAKEFLLLKGSDFYTRAPTPEECRRLGISAD